MDSGYVYNFSNRTFEDFVLENTEIDVYTNEYAEGGTSKANRLRLFWKKESNYLTAKLIEAMLEYWKSQKLISANHLQQSEQLLYKECLKIVSRLKQENPIEDIDALRPNSKDKGFSLLANSIRESIKRGQPDQALDRLHTFLVKYTRALCDRHNIKYSKKTPLHSLFGGYVKFLRENNLIDSNMSERILKSSISVLEAFNSVRNNQTFAHDNPILNYNESVLIFNNISNILRFIESIESKISEEAKEGEGDEVNWEDIDFDDDQIDAAVDSWIELGGDTGSGK